ncbi:hypothetical protein PP352_21635 [Mycobacteroides abscessus]|nr:hypothetical protein [Mycobacteroides abscessus]
MTGAATGDHDSPLPEVEGMDARTRAAFSVASEFPTPFARDLMFRLYSGRTSLDDAIAELNVYSALRGDRPVMPRFELPDPPD